MRLRRPATIYVQDGTFVPDRSSLDEVDSRFTKLCKQNPAVYDGRILHVLGVHRNGHGGANIHAMECAYRFYAVQTESYDLGIRPLGVKGITMFETSYLWGKRSRHVHQYKQAWEYVPAGCVEPGKQPDDAILQELQEEAGLAVTGNPIQVGIVFDEHARTWELIYKLESSSGTVCKNDEYEEIQWISGDKLPSGRSPIAEIMLGYA